MKIYLHHPLYHIPLPKRQKEFFAVKKSLRVLKLLRIITDRVLFRFLNDMVLYRFLSDGVLLKVLSHRVIFESSAIRSSSRSSVIDSSLRSSVLFFRHVATFLLKCAIIFGLLKTCSVSHYIFKKKCTLNSWLNMF